MKGKRHGEINIFPGLNAGVSREVLDDRAQKRGNMHREFWSKRPLSMWAKTPENKRISRRLERRRVKIEQDD